METKIFYVLSKYFWLLGIAVTGINALAIELSCRRHIRQHPELRLAYSRVMCGMLVWWNLPWVVMGIGIMLGRVPTLWHYFFEIRGNVFVLAWWVSVFAMAIVSSRWAFSHDAAQLCSRLSRLCKWPLLHATGIGVFILVALAGGLVLFTAIYLRNPPLPEFIKQIEQLAGL